MNDKKARPNWSGFFVSHFEDLSVVEAQLLDNSHTVKDELDACHSCTRRNLSKSSP